MVGGISDDDVSGVTSVVSLTSVAVCATTLTVLVILTVNRWRTVVSATWKYDDPRLNMSHEGAARVWHLQPRVVIFPCRTHYRVSYVLSSDQLQESWIICKLKSKKTKCKQKQRAKYYVWFSDRAGIELVTKQLVEYLQHVTTCQEVSSWHVVNILRPPDSR